MSATLQRQYQRLRTEIGKERVEHLGVLSGVDFRRFSTAVRAPTECAETFDASGVQAAHPLYLSSVMSWGAGAPETHLDADGTSEEETRGLPLYGVRLMGAGQDLEFHAPVLEGTQVSVRTSLEDVQIKRGASGTLLILQVLRQFVDGDGHPLITCRESFVAR